MITKHSIIFLLKKLLKSNPSTTPSQILSFALDHGLSRPSSELLSMSKIMPETLLHTFEIPNTTPPKTPYHPLKNNYSKLFNWNEGNRRFFTLILNKDGFIHHGHHGFNAYRDNESGQIYVIDNNDGYAELMRDESTHNKAHESWIKNGSIHWINSLDSVRAASQLDLLKSSNEFLAIELLLKSNHFTLQELNQYQCIDYFSDSFHPNTFSTILTTAINFKTNPLSAATDNTSENITPPIPLNNILTHKTNS